jgi:hypothetical protein
MAIAGESSAAFLSVKVRALQGWPRLGCAQ